MKYLNKVFNILKIDIDPNRIYDLDVLRAFAIIVVLYGHSRHFLEGYVNMDIYKLFLFDGVTVFFVLSGFLIGSILIKVVNKTDFGRKDLLDFWIRRWFRTVPNYFLILTIVCFVTFWLDGIFFFESWKYYFFIQNFYTPHPYFFPEAWSLSVEEWFYLLVPVILMCFIKLVHDKKKALLSVILLIIFTVTLFRTYRAVIYNCEDVDCWGSFIRNQVVTRLDSLMFGVLGAYTLYYYNDLFLKNKNIQFCIGIILLIIPQIYDFIYQDMFFKNYLTFLLTSVGTLLMLPKLYSIKSGSGYLYKGLTAISLISYSMYLINYTLVKKYFFKVLYLFIPELQSINLIGSITNYLLFWFVTIVFSIVLYKYYEMPMTKLRDKI
jgi:peptidoglycan/LPS O-acetylase OafA/YrhL